MSSLPPDYLDLAPWYDALYTSTGPDSPSKDSPSKDYDAEAAGVRAYVDTHHPQARTLLDVACGTGQHLSRWVDTFDEVVGSDVAPAMLAVARERLGADVALVEADFRTLQLGRRFDVVTCLFSAIGHVDDALEIEFAWTVATPQGIDTARWQARMPVFPRERLLAAVERAGLTPRWEPEAPWPSSRRGWLVGVAAER